MIWLEENPGMTRETLLNRLARAVADTAIALDDAHRAQFVKSSDMKDISPEQILASDLHFRALREYRAAKGGK